MSMQTAVTAVVLGVVGAVMFVFGMIAIASGEDREGWAIFSLLGLGLHTFALGLIVEVKEIK